MSLRLIPERNALICALLRRNLSGVEVWAYGSRIAGKARPDSDLDLVVVGGAEKRQPAADLREAFEENDLPFRMDLFLWGDPPASFRKNIRRNHIVLQPRASRAKPDRCLLFGCVTLRVSGKRSRREAPT